MYFYPAAMTPGCTTQAVDFSAAREAFAEAGYKIVGISPDPVERLAAFADGSRIDFPLLSDADRQVMNSYGAFGGLLSAGLTFSLVLQAMVNMGVAVGLGPGGTLRVETGTGSRGRLVTEISAGDVVHLRGDVRRGR